MKNHTSKLIIFLAAFFAGTALVVFFWQFRQSPVEAQKQTDTQNNETVQPALPQPQIKELPLNESSNSAIGKIDFGNFKYPSIWKWLKHPVKLKNGELEFEEDRCGTTISLEEIKYLDFTNDGEDDALVILHNHTACGSSSNQFAFFVFTMRNKRPQIIWKFTTGSEAHGGTRDFWLDNNELVVELYGRCKIVGVEPKVDYSEIEFGGGTDWALKSTTKFRFGWNGQKFGQKSVEVLPYPYKSTFDDKDEKHYR